MADEQETPRTQPGGDSSLDDLRAEALRRLREEAAGETAPLGDAVEPQPVPERRDPAKTNPLFLPDSNSTGEPDDTLPFSPPAAQPGTGSLMRRITGSLRRLTGPLGGREVEGAESAPEQPAPVPAPRVRTPEDDYVSQLRQTLSTDEPGQHQRTGRTGQLLRFITDRLRRVTGPLGRTGAMRSQRQPAEEAPPQLDHPVEPLPGQAGEEAASVLDFTLPDDRFAVAAPKESTAWPVTEPLEETGPANPRNILDGLPEDFVFETPQDVQERLFGPSEPSTEPLPEISWEPVEPELFSGRTYVEPPLETRTPAISSDAEALDRLLFAGEPQPEEPAEDWITALRQQDIDSEEDIVVEPDDNVLPEISIESVPDSSDWLAEFRNAAPDPEAEPPVDAPEEPRRNRRSLTDPLRALFTGVLGKKEEPAPAPDAAALTDELMTDRLERSLGKHSPEEEAASLEDRFHLFGENTGVPAQTIGLPEDIQVSPEEETLLWGEEPAAGVSEEPRTIRADDYWDPAHISRTTGRLDTDPSAIHPEDMFAAEFLTGESDLPTMEPPKENLLRDALTGAKTDDGAVEAAAPETLRSIVLEDMHEVPGAELEEPLAMASGTRPASWLSQRTWTERILLLEGILAILAAIFVVPLFVMVIARGPQEIPNVLQARPLPPDVPYPTGIVLPGGWSFALEKSTFRENQWRPARPEWLEGTEIRRVVALPWNEQTEAVVQTFQPGDPVEIQLSNGDAVRYKVVSIQRVDTSDVSIYADRRPSLAVILYKEDAKERWVVICRK